MQGSVRLGRIIGVEVGLHYSWFLVFGLVTWSLAAVYFPSRYPSWPVATTWTAGLITSILFFVSVLGHELAHSLVAKRIGLEVESITLFIFGGMASISRDTERARDEFAVAIAGPASSLALGLIFAVLGWAATAAGSDFRVVSAVAWWLATINVMLGIFNLIPGFPMDGGRVLRSIIWGASGNMWLATKAAAAIGLGIAYLMMLGGVFLAVTGSVANAVWLILVGWFLSSAAQASYRHARTQESLKGVTVNEAMDRDYQSVSPYASVGEALETYFRGSGLVAVPVLADDRRVLGVVTKADLQRIPSERRANTPVFEAMSDPEAAPLLAPEDQVNDVLNAIGSKEFAAAPVIADGRIIGLLTRSGILTLIRNRRRRAIGERTS